MRRGKWNLEQSGGNRKPEIWVNEGDIPVRKTRTLSGVGKWVNSTHRGTAWVGGEGNGKGGQ